MEGSTFSEHGDAYKLMTVLSLSLSLPPSLTLCLPLYSQAKGATDNRDLVRLGLFSYPVLMAADVLLYK